VKTVKLIPDAHIEFEKAQRLAGVEASKHLQEPMNLSWLDRVADRQYPNVECCSRDGKESWEVYAESRGGKVRVEIGDSYIFIYREGAINN